jgi:cytochrome P450
VESGCGTTLISLRFNGVARVVASLLAMTPRASVREPSHSALGADAAIEHPAPHAAVAGFDLKKLSGAFLEDPYPTYRALRQSDPVHRMPDGSYFLTRYDDCLSLYRDVETWSSDKKLDFRPNFADSLLYEHHTTSLVFNDPPYHTRVRKLLAPAFAPRALGALQDRIEKLVDRLLQAAAERGEIDLISDFAAAIPVQLIGDMLGIPQDERGPLRAWSLAILGALEPVLSRQQFDTGVAAVGDFKAYLNDIISSRLRSGHNDPAEILSKLIGASDFAAIDGEGERLSKLELVHNCIFLLNAGHETTTNLIGNAVDLLIRHPEAMIDLRSHPQAMETAVEEFLRMESSNQLGNRRAVSDTTLGGVEIAAGIYVHICIGAANRDPEQFHDPDRLDIRRQPNRHLAFATGIHACAGMSLARMEAQVAIGRLLQRFTRIEPAAAPVRSPRARFRGFTSYPLRLGA